MILVTGASGNVGAEVTRTVLAAGHEVRALSRQSSAQGIPAGAEIVAGDLNDRSSLRPAFAGADAVFLLAGYPDVAGLLADMRAAGVGRVVLLSTGAVAGGDLDNDVVRFNVVSEAAVRDSGLDWTVLRPSGFMSNTLQWIPQLRAGDVVRESFADVPIAMIDPFDIAAVAALTLTSDGHNQSSYRLTGPGSLLPATGRRSSAAYWAGIFAWSPNGTTTPAAGWPNRCPMRWWTRSSSSSAAAATTTLA
jgi:uncharacterized protein YbjT (DUF2867 family)